MVEPEGVTTQQERAQDGASPMGEVDVLFFFFLPVSHLVAFRSAPRKSSILDPKQSVFKSVSNEYEIKQQSD